MWNATGAAIGSTRYLDIRPKDRQVEIGSTFLGRAYWRTPANTEAKYLLLRHAFESLGCVRVALKTDGRNTRSQAAIERLGAVREGVLRKHMNVRGYPARHRVLLHPRDGVAGGEGPPRGEAPGDGAQSSRDGNR